MANIMILIKSVDGVSLEHLVQWSQRSIQF